MPGEDGRGRGGDGNSPATQDKETSRNSGSGENMMSGPGPLPPPIPQREMLTGRGSEVSTHRHPDSANGASPKHGMLVRRKYRLLTLEEPAGDPAAAELQEFWDGHEATMGTGGPYVRVTETGYRNGQRTLQACNHQEDADEDRRPPKWQRALNTCSHQGGEGGGGPPTQKQAPTVCSPGIEGDPPTRQRSPPACDQGMEE